MTLKEHLLKCLSYNEWANKRICGTARELTDEKWEVEIISSFSSVRKTLLHMLDAQIVWLNRLNSIDVTQWPSTGYTGSNDEIIQMFTEQSAQFAAYFKEKNDAYLVSSCVYNDFKGNPHTTMISDIVQHVINHSTFHRGQLVTMLRQLCLDKIPSTDYIVYSREQKFR